MNDRGNYQAFSNDIVQTDWQTLKSENINTYAENITERITTLANTHIHNRVINALKTDPTCLTTHVKKLIRKKRLYDKYKKSNLLRDFRKAQFHIHCLFHMINLRMFSLSFFYPLAN